MSLNFMIISILTPVYINFTEPFIRNVACKLANDAAAKSTKSGTLEERSRDDNIEISFIVID